MSELRELYQEMIIDHGRHPRNFGPLLEASHRHEGYNPLCGDKVTLAIQEQNGIIQQARFEGCGCAISMASASLLTEAIQGQSVERVKQLFADFHLLLTTQQHEADLIARLGKLAVFSGVSAFPVRVKCAILVWHVVK